MIIQIWPGARLSLNHLPVTLVFVVGFLYGYMLTKPIVQLSQTFGLK